MSEPQETRPVELSFEASVASHSASRTMAVIDALAAMLEIEPEEIELGQFEAERMMLELPAPAARQLGYLLKTNSSRLRLLKLSRVVLEKDFSRREAWNLQAGRFERAELPSEPVLELAEPVKVSLFRPLLVALMVGSVGWAFAHALNLVVSDYRVGYLTLACMLAAVEAGYSHQVVRARRMLADDAFKFRIFEFIMLFIVLRFSVYVGRGWEAAAADLTAWPHNPLLIFEGETLVAFFMAAVCWFVSNSVAHEWVRIGEPPERDPFIKSPLDNLGNLFFWGGGFLLAMSGVALVIGSAAEQGIEQWSLASVRAFFGRSSSSPGMALNILFYFLVGLVMLGQVRFTTLNRHWRDEDIAVDEKLAGRWTRASLLLVILPVLLALILPTGYSFGVFGFFRTAMFWAITVAVYVTGLLLFTLLSVIMALLSFLFRRNYTMPSQVRPEPIQMYQVVDGSRPPPDWVIWMRTILFWGLIIAGLVYVLRIYLRDHPEIKNALVNFRPLPVLRRWWELIKAWWASVRKKVTLRLPRLPKRSPRETTPSRPSLLRFLRLGALSPRERVLYYYWSTLRRAKRIGLGRRPPQTPNEYRSSLGPHLPEAQEPVKELTEAFLEARYSDHSIAAGREKDTRPHWRAVKKALQHQKSKPEEKRDR